MEQYKTTKSGFQDIPQTVQHQACVLAIKNAKIPVQIKSEMSKFIYRNILPDCKRVPPNCLKAHLIRTAKKFGVSHEKLSYMKKLFKSKIGFKGYYLDGEELKKI